MSKYVKDKEHEEILYHALMGVERSLCIATADLKNLYINGVRILEIFKQLMNRGVKIRVLCSSPRTSILEALPEYITKGSGNGKFKMKVCPRNHMKMFVFDWATAYIGSANLTNAAMGGRNKQLRNFEAGIFTNDETLVTSMKGHFDEAWSKRSCDECLSKLCKNSPKYNVGQTM